MRTIRILAALVAFAIPGLALAGTWAIDADHSTVGFKVKHMMVSNVSGSFVTKSGTVLIDDKDITKSKVDVVIDTASINTGVGKRDDHLRSADFFEVTKYPKMTFASKSIKKVGSDRLLIAGDLTIRGITRPVVLDVEGPTKAYKDPWGNVRRGASATTKINRKDFGLVWNAALETGGVVVGDDVTINLEIEMIQK